MKTLRLLLFILVATITSSVFSQTVYVTKTGKKYHKQSCYYLKSSMRELSLERAIELGYESCSVCKPSTKITKKVKVTETNSTPTEEKIETVTSTSKKATQCTGKTKSGNRCKRMTTNSNGRCYQHQN